MADIKKYIPLIIIALLIIGNGFLFLDNLSLKKKIANDSEQDIENNFNEIDKADEKIEKNKESIANDAKEVTEIKKLKKENDDKLQNQIEHIKSINSADSLEKFFTRRYEGLNHR